MDNGSIPNVSQIRDELKDLEIRDTEDFLFPYSADEALKSADLPAAVLFPKSTEQVSEIMKLAHKNNWVIVPRGAGSGLSGGAVPYKNSLVLSLERMDQILEIRSDEQQVVVQPGVITSCIRDAVEKEGFFYPPVPASIDFCTIGGNVATNAGGLCAVKYGVTREYVMGLEVVLPSGEIIRTGGGFRKNTTGYNLTQLFCGSEGTLGIITEILLKILPQPRSRLTLLAPFAKISSAGQAVLDILETGIVPPTLELIPKAAVECVLEKHPDLVFPFPKAAASLLIELDSRSLEISEDDLVTLHETLKKNVESEPLVASTRENREELWTLRKLIRESIAQSQEFVEADSVVPRKNVPALLEAASRIEKDTGVRVISYGHAGDGNLHTYFQRGNLKEKKWNALSAEVLRRFFEATVELGGTLSGEHGIGLLKRDFMPMVFSKAELQLMRDLKKAMDPKGILNPGKVLPL